MASERTTARYRMLFPAVGILLIAVFAVVFRNVSPPRLNINTDPRGASVFMNGRLVGSTPITLSDLNPGTYSVRLEKEGYVSLVKPATLTSSDLTLIEKMERTGTGKITVDIKPGGAEVLLDGEFIGHTPLKDRDVPVGVHELLVRKTNFKPQSWRIEVTAAEPLRFTGFALEDKILAMLRSNVEADKQRVSHYMDLGHYLFINDELDEAAEAYARAVQVAGTELEFDALVEPSERQLETRLRAEDRNRLNDEVRKKSNWPGKDVARFRAILAKQQEAVAEANFTDWLWVQEQSNNFIRDEKFERAQTLLVKHIEATAKGTQSLPQAYIALLSLRLRMHNLEKSKETFDQFHKSYGARADLARQAANSIYSTYASYQGEERKVVLGMAEKLLVKGVESSRKGDAELNALCTFELANVMTLQGRAEGAAPIYKESISGTNHAETKELRTQRLIEAYRTLGRNAEARTLLTELAASPREHIATKAKADIKELDLLKPSPDGK
jgi:hypothetical protein